MERVCPPAGIGEGVKKILMEEKEEEVRRSSSTLNIIYNDAWNHNCEMCSSHLCCDVSRTLSSQTEAAFTPTMLQGYSHFCFLFEDTVQLCLFSFSLSKYGTIFEKTYPQKLMRKKLGPPIPLKTAWKNLQFVNFVWQPTLILTLVNHTPGKVIPG